MKSPQVKRSFVQLYSFWVLVEFYNFKHIFLYAFINVGYMQEHSKGGDVGHVREGGEGGVGGRE